MLLKIACQNWTSFDVTETTGGSIKTRVNHTMVIRPPSGGNRTSWTAYIFGGFDGAHRSDVLNITLNLAPMADADVNNCRGIKKTNSMCVELTVSKITWTSLTFCYFFYFFRSAALVQFP